MRRNSKIIYIIKALSIFSVICAHVAIGESSSRINMFCIRLLSNLGTIGVPAFFYISGYLYSLSRDSFFSFWKKKLLRIIIPWILSALFIYLQCLQLYNPSNWIIWINNNLRTFRAVDYFKLLLGYNSLFYYISILLFFYLLFWKVRRKAKVLSASIILSVVCFLYFCKYEYVFITPYLNPFNWMWCFSAGSLISLLEDDKRIKRCIAFIKMYWILFACIGLLAVLLISWIDIPMSYFCAYYLMFENIELISLFALGYGIEKSKILSHVFMRIGKDSYPIYLFHITGQTVVVRLLDFIGVVGIILRPIVLLIIVEAVIQFIILLKRMVIRKRK